MDRQINDNGQALQRGLDVFISVPILSNEYLSYGDSFVSDTLSTTTIDTSTADYATEAVTSASMPTYSNSNWQRYGSDGTIYPSVTEVEPFSSNNIIGINAIVTSGVSSHSGIFQELKTLIIGKEYNIKISFHQANVLGTIAISRLYNSNTFPSVLTQSDVTSYDLPLSEISLDFIAYSISDILFIDFSSSVNDSQVKISSISVKEKNSYSLPVIAEMPRIGFSKVLRRVYDQSIPLEEGETIT